MGQLSMRDRQAMGHYKNALDRAAAKWAKETETELAKKLLPITKKLQELAKVKNPGPMERKECEALEKEACALVAKTLKKETDDLKKDLSKVKPPDLDAFDQDGKQPKVDYGFTTKLDLPDVFKDKHLAASADADDKRFIVGFSVKW